VKGKVEGSEGVEMKDYMQKKRTFKCRGDGHNNRYHETKGM
jgi:hypothetical protein